MPQESGAKPVFTIFGVLLLIYLALMIVGMLFGIGAGMMGLGTMGEYM